MNLEENKKNAIAFYKMAYEGNPKEAISAYVGDTYIQHNPDVGNGLQGFIDYFQRMQKNTLINPLNSFVVLQKEI